jgi:CDP-paratose 2-epimerase
VTIYGDGKQVRDLLWVEDLVDLYVRLLAKGAEVGAAIFSVGGGASNTLSLLELMAKIERLQGEPLDWSQAAPRVADQRWFVANPARLSEHLGWRPGTGVDESVEKLWAWLCEHREMIETTIGGLHKSSRVV